MSKQTQTKTIDNAVIGAGIRPQTQTSDQAQTQQQTDVMDKTNIQQQTIASAITENMLAARAAGQRVLKAYDLEDKAKGEASASMVDGLWRLHKEGRKYVEDLAIPDGASAERLKLRTAAVKLAAADMGFTAFASPEAKERTWVSAKAKRSEQTMRQVAGLVLRMIREDVAPTLNKSGLLKVPGKFLLDKEQRENEDYADVLDKPLTLDFSTQEGPVKYSFVKSFTRARDLANQELGLASQARKPAGQTDSTKAAVFTFSEEGARQASDFLGKYLANRTAVGATVARETKDALQHLFANLGTFLGAISEDGKHIVPAVADVVLTQAAK